MTKAITKKGKKVHRLDDEKEGGVTLCGLRVHGACWPYVEGPSCKNCQRVLAARMKCKTK